MPSVVWDSFTKDGEFAKCKLCAKKVGYKGGSTTALHRHLQGVHKIFKGSAAATSSQGSIRGYTKRLDCPESKSEIITSLIARMIATDSLPISIVENEGFRDLMEFLEPGYKVPVHRTMTSYIQAKYNAEKSKLKESLGEVEDVALTTDCWTSRTQIGYMTVTAHYMQDGQNKSKVLDTMPVESLEDEEGNIPEGPQRHTADALAAQLVKITDEWSISEKVCAVVHDNASNTRSISAKAHLPNSCDIGCAAHTLQLSIKKGLAIDGIKNMIADANKLVAHFKRSPIATGALEAKQVGLDLPKRRLITACATRWNSQFEMLSRVLENRYAIMMVLDDKAFTKPQDAPALKLKEETWTLMTATLPCLKPLQVATTVLSADLYVTASVVRPVISGILSEHLTPKDTDLPDIRRFKEMVAADMRVRFCNELSLTSAIMMATVLDPRFKDLKFLDDDDTQQVYDEVERLLEPLQQQERQPAPKKAKSASGLDFLLGSAATDDASDEEKDELQDYKDLQEHCIDSTTDPVQWWESHKEQYPTLVMLARKYMCIPATSVPSERVFSVAGNIVNAKRNALKPENVNMLVFLAKITKN